MTGIPYDEMPRYIEQYREGIENLTNSALQLNEIVKEKQKIIDKAIEYIELWHYRNDFSKENLYKSTNQEQCYLHNWGTFSTNPRLTEIGILSARLTIKAKEKMYE